MVNATSTNKPAGAPWSIAHAAEFLGVSQRHLHRLIEARRVKSVLIGRRRLIPATEIERLSQQGC